MLNLRTPGVLARRSLPQRYGQFNIYPHSNQVSSHFSRHAGFNATAVVVDAIVSGREALLWSNKYGRKLSYLIRRHVFGLFVISFSAIQFLPAYAAEPVITKTVETTPQVELFSASVKAVDAPIFQRPVDGSLSQNFWYVHPAIDIPNPYGTNVKPIDVGKVVFAGWDGGFGYSVIVSHKAGFTSRYAHLAQVKVTVGQKVTKKTTIGLVGATGVATGSHLHLEVYDDGKNVDPQTYLPSQ